MVTKTRKASCQEQAGQFQGKDQPSSKASGQIGQRQAPSGRQAQRQAGDRRVAGQGAHGGPLPGQGLHGEGLGRPRARPAEVAACGRRGAGLRADLPRAQRRSARRSRSCKLEVDEASEVYLATDPDREGEAIAWHLVEATGMRAGAQPAASSSTRSPTDAVAEAFAHPRQLNMDLVNAQQARRILDRLVGYKISPLLWEQGADAAPRPAACSRWPCAWWSSASARSRPSSRSSTGRSTRGWPSRRRAAQPAAPDFLAKLHRLRGEEVNLGNEADTQAIVDDLEGAHYLVTDGARGRAAAPAGRAVHHQHPAAGGQSRKLGYNARQTMRAAQQLYEGIDIGQDEQVGLITYMRTDSVNVSKQAQDEARQFIGERYGAEYLPPTPPVYKTRAKGAQEAHEAIRPTSVMRTPESVATLPEPRAARSSTT